VSYQAPKPSVQEGHEYNYNTQTGINLTKILKRTLKITDIFVVFDRPLKEYYVDDFVIAMETIDIS
jgi:hypothetical protein